MFKWFSRKKKSLTPQYVVQVFIKGEVGFQGLFQETLEMANERARQMSSQINQWYADNHDANARDNNIMVPCVSCLGPVSYFEAPSIKYIRVSRVW